MSLVVIIFLVAALTWFVAVFLNDVARPRTKMARVLICVPILNLVIFALGAYRRFSHWLETGE